MYRSALRRAVAGAPFFAKTRPAALTSTRPISHGVTSTTWKASPSMLPFASAAAVVGLGSGYLLSGSFNQEVSADEQGESFKQRKLAEYENRIRSMSSPEKIFKYFASVRENGQSQMTPEDFIRAITPYASCEEDMSSSTTSRKASHDEVVKIFNLVDQEGDGLISFAEYLFFVTLLGIPENDFRIAFMMFDTSGDGTIDKNEFENVMKVMRSKSPQARSQHSGKVALNQGLISHFFGEKGNKGLSYERFSSFLKNLHRSVLGLKFSKYDSTGSGLMSPRDFGYAIIAHVGQTHLQDMKSKCQKLSDKGLITFKQYCEFNEVLKNIDDIYEAVENYGAEKGNVTQADFQRASRAVAHVELSPVQVEVIFLLFDKDGDGHLDPEEFKIVMSKAKNHGLNQSRDIGFLRFGDCFMNCVTNATRKKEPEPDV